MGHTVMCVCTVYFTAIVGCAFSSPRLTAGESQQNDSKTVHEARLEVGIKENISSTKTVNSSVDEANVETFNKTNLDDSGGGSKIENFTENISPETESTLNISSETDSINGTEHSLVKHLNKTKIKEIIRNRHMEGLKQQMLSKLRMTYPPKLQHGKMPQLPMDELVKVYFELSSDETYRRHSHYYAKTVRKFIVGQDVTHRCATKKSAGCYFFDLRGRVDASEVQSVHLWIYKLFNQNDPYMETFVISELDKIKRRKNNLRIKNIVERYDTTQKFGWLKIDVTKSAMKWLLKPRLNHGIAVICKGCKRKYYRTIYSTKDNSKPFVVVTTRKSHRRDRRSYENECTETSTECCLKPFSINFREIGWDAVAYPPSIQANYCTGGCNAQYAATTNHTNLIQNYRWTVATEMDMEALKPCCSPISYRAQSILYFDGDKLQEARIPNIAATACGCL